MKAELQVEPAPAGAPERGVVSPGAALEKVMPLVKEYTEKLTADIRRVIELKKEWEQASGFFGGPNAKKREFLTRELSFLRDRATHLRVPTLELARSASALIEWADIDLTGKLELRLRLAELESAIKAAAEMAEAPLPG